MKQFLVSRGRYVVQKITIEARTETEALHKAKNLSVQRSFTDLRPEDWMYQCEGEIK